MSLIVETSREKMERASRERFFAWISECCAELGKPTSYGGDLLADQSWFFAYDDRLTPKEAVTEYLASRKQEAP